MSGHTHIWRALGTGLVLLTWLLFNPNDNSLLQQLLIPLLAGMGVYLILQMLFPVLLASAVLAILHSQPGNGDWVSGWVYPCIGVLSSVGVAAVLWLRFRQRIRQTHEARWSTRKGDQPPANS